MSRLRGRQMDFYWEVIHKEIGVKKIQMELKGKMIDDPFNVITISLTNDIMIRMTMGEWQNIGAEIGKQIREELNKRYGKFAEPENGSS